MISWETIFFLVKLEYSLHSFTYVEFKVEFYCSVTWSDKNFFCGSSNLILLFLPSNNYLY